MKNKLIVLTGAGIDAESGIPTFRTGTDALWNGYSVEDVATPQGWKKNRELVQNFYNQRRKEVLNAQPNAAHLALVKLEEKYDVTIITTNISNLHERAGSSNVLHLHGLITKSQSSINPKLTYPIEGDEIKIGELCEKGSQLRPHVVWFGEDVPMILPASELCYDAEIFILCGTSLVVYPAAGLIKLVQFKVPKYIVDPNIPDEIDTTFKIFKEKATIGIPKLVKELLKQYIC